MELLRQMQERPGPNHYTEERFESDEFKAQAIVEEEFEAAAADRGAIERAEEQ